MTIRPVSVLREMLAKKGMPVRPKIHKKEGTDTRKDFDMNIQKIASLPKRALHKLKRAIIPVEVMENVNQTTHDKNCLMCYITSPFLASSNSGHQNQVQTPIIAQVLGDLGYNVDVLDYYQKHVKLRKKYDAVFDISVEDVPVYKNHLQPNAKRIVYFTGSDPAFQNTEEKKRVDAASQRRGVKLKTRRDSPLHSRTIEQFDGALLIGNEKTLRTYSNFCLPETYLIPNTGYEFDDNRFDYSKVSSKNFLYFGSSGAVHKGLDLLLEIFSEKDFPAHLYVCGDFFESETDFVKAYQKELYHTPNIHAMGHVNILGDQFTQLVDACAYTILPSCSEGMAGSINTCMSAGIIPICSVHCGFDEDDVILLSDCEMETIRATVLEYCSQSQDWIAEQRCKMLALSKEKFSIAQFKSAIQKALSAILRDTEE